MAGAKDSILALHVRGHTLYRVRIMMHPKGTRVRGARAAAPRAGALSAVVDATEQVSTPFPPRTDWTRLVPPPVLTGHLSSLLPY